MKKFTFITFFMCGMLFCNLVFASEAFIYSDDEAGITFSVPENWIQKELSEDRSFIDAKFVPIQENGNVIVYGSSDMWEGIPASDRIGYNRADVNNSTLTKTFIAEMCSITEDKVSVIKYNGVEYYFYEMDTSLQIYDVGVTVPTTCAIHINNGWMYMFQFGGAVDSKYFSDFEKLLSSVKISTDSNLLDAENSGTLSDTYSQNYSTDDKLTSDFFETLIVGFFSTIFVYMLCPFIIIVTRKKFSKKVLRRITIANGIVGFIIFTAFNFIVGEYQIAKIHIAILWSSIAFWILLKTSLETKSEYVLSKKAEIRFCRICGNQLIDDSDFCDQCGNKVIKE